MRLAVYARYSTDAQKESSIHRQVKHCTAYYTMLGVRHHTLFADEGESGSTSVQRKKLQKLLEACDEGKFDAIVVEDFDRWSRDLYDSVDIARRLDIAGVQLHCAAVRRYLSLDDVVKLAMAAQHDKERRKNLCMDGLDQMVIDNHGMPWGRCFGYAESGVPGHPDLDPEQSKAVRRAFELGLKFSAIDTARKLGEEGHFSPKGTLLWSAGMVSAIWSCTTYAGLVRYRKKRHTRDAKTGKVVSRIRPAHEMKQAYNDKFEIVSRETFMAVQNAKRGRTRGEGTAGCTKKKGPVMLFGAATCDCRGAVDQKFYSANSRYHCSLDRERGSCLSKTTKGFPIEIVDRAILAVLRGSLAPRMSDIKFKKEFESGLLEKALELDAKRQPIELQLEKANAYANQLLDSQFVRGSSEERVIARRMRAEDKVTELMSDLASIPKLDHLAVDYDGNTARLRDAFALLEDRIPFLPSSNNDEKLIELLATLVKDVRLLREDRPTGVIAIEIDIRWAALFVGRKQAEACAFPVETLRTEVVLNYLYSVNEGSREHWEKVAASGVYALTSAQWQLVKLHLPDTTRTDHGGKSALTTRQVADAVIFKMRTGTGIISPPAFFGERKALVNAMHRFIYAGGVETLVDVVGGADPKWLVGLDVESLAGKLRAANSTKFSRVSVMPEQTAARCAIAKTFHLTDKQWDRVKGVVDPGIEAPRNRERRSVSARRFLDGILVKLRTGCAWDKMPPAYGATGELKLAAMSFAYLGSWDRVVDILRKDFPVVLDGLQIEKMDNMPKRVRAGGVQNLRIIAVTGPKDPDMFRSAE
jgi:DNA invertase Pin-like site-specific DNA recombinase/transposase